ncbi:MAG: endonuclease/exonuclease/phosphatase family protein [Saprospiraceae bacterium]|nr:endonuclease/exonuclease/phosphatase family protein [Saprospiraceae bacterium]
MEGDLCNGRQIELALKQDSAELYNFNEVSLLAMLQRLFRHPLVNGMLVIGMIGLALLCIVKIPDVVLLKRIASHAIQIMLLFVAAGLFFLFANQQRLLFIAFGCAGALCLHFKYVGNISLALPVKTSEKSITILHTNTDDFSDDWHSVINTIIGTDADVVSFIEVTPNWAQLLLKVLDEYYPHHALITRIDPFGTAIFSRYPVVHRDTVVYENLPNLSAAIKIDNKKFIKVFSSNSNPPLFRSSFEKLRNQLDVMAKAISSSSHPVITAGNYNLDQFSDELQDFRAEAKLEDSRKTMSPSINPPTNHLFHTRDLECLRFFNVYDEKSNRLGIMGEYQFKSDDQATAQGG